MSKAIETARRPVFKEDVLHSHIAETYFRQKTRSKSRKKKQAFHLNIELVRIFVTALIIAISAVFILASSNYLYKYYINILQNRTAKLKVINVISQGLYNKSIINKFEFRGYARRGRSEIIKNAVILTNPKKYNWADLVIGFKFPIDMSARNLSLSMRGNMGGEKINVVLRDTRNKSSRIDDISLSSGAQELIIPTSSIKSDIDITGIDHIRIEYGKPGESVSHADSPINVTVYVNNLSLVKEL